jgi:hypothetical protein
MQLIRSGGAWSDLPWSIGAQVQVLVCHTFYVRLGSPYLGILLPRNVYTGSTTFQVSEVTYFS